MMHDATVKFCARFVDRRSLEQEFLKRGGLRERMTRARLGSGDVARNIL